MERRHDLGAGTRLRLHPTGEPCRIVSRLGAGGQGAVYEAALADDSRIAVKWYFGDSYSASLWHWQCLTNLVERGAPDARFLWPIALTSESGERPRLDGEPFGYAMALREPRFHGLNDVMTRVVRPELTQLVIGAFQLADSFRRLHSRGWAYRDISEGNAFLDPRTGDIAICDNDNVSVDGEPTLIRGTPRYMAPEIVLDEVEPSRLTDLWSLAVLLFHLLLNNHPLEGARAHAIHCLDWAAHRVLFAERPVFIFHPEDRSNRPVPGAQDAPIALWSIYPRRIQELFARTFVDGLADADQRPQEAEWQAALAALRDLIVRCPRCNGENFCDVNQLRLTGVPGRCFRCATELAEPKRIDLRTAARTSTVVLAPGTQLYPHHFGTAYDYSRPTAEVVTHPERPGALGLHNLSPHAWTYVGNDRRSRTAAPGQTMPLLGGVNVRFGDVEGAVAG